MTPPAGTVGAVRLLALLALFAIAEMAVFIWVGSEIGALWAIAIVIITAIAGAFLVGKGGLAAIRRIRGRIDQGQVPGRELSDGAVVVVAGLFLLSPGFISDLVGITLLVPGVQAAIHRTLSKRISARVTVFTDRRMVRRGGSDQRSLPEDVIIDIDPD